VKLHFNRPINLSCRDQIRAIEAEYFDLPFPEQPSLKGPGCFTIFWLFGIPASFVMMSEDLASGLGALLFYSVFIGLGLFWIKTRIAKRKSAQEACLASLNRAQELREEARQLLESV